MVSLGCPKNVVDGEVLLGDLQRNGFKVVQDHEEADAVIVNTCAFVQDAKSESLEAIVEVAALNKDGRQRKVVVTGCLAQRYADQLADNLAEADLVVGFEKYDSLSTTLKDTLVVRGGQENTRTKPVGTGRVQVGHATVPFRPEWDRFRLTPRHTAYLRVAEGCNHACTFCAIPGFRGKFRSKPWQPLLDEARFLVESGVKELNLIAEDTNQYGMDRRDGRGLAELLRELSSLEGLHWMRILYAYPSYFTEELIDEIADNPKVCKYIDIPLQHINNLMLLGMNRPAKEHTVQLLTKLRERIPSLSLRTTFISGFPGEQEPHHRELVNFVKDFRFERMGCFTYSQEDGTPAAGLTEQVPDMIRQRRRDELTSIQQRIGREFAESLVGRKVDVLVDGRNDEGWLIGRTQWDAPEVDPVVFLSESLEAGVPPLEVGQIRTCLVDSNSLFDLEAHPVV